MKKSLRMFGFRGRKRDASFGLPTGLYNRKNFRDNLSNMGDEKDNSANDKSKVIIRRR